MKRRHVHKGIILFSLFLIAEINIYAEAHLDHEPEFLEKPDVTLHEYTSIQKVTVDKNKESTRYSTIQNAIDEAAPGTTIYVKSGIYSEILNIKKPLNLIGENRENTIINPISKENSFAISIQAEGVEINGFTISNKANGLYTTGIKITAQNTKIKDCTIYDTAVGIAIWSSENQIIKCTFKGCADEGIAFLGTPQTKCANNVVQECRFIENCDGIELQYSSHNLISDCEFSHNTHAAIDAISSDNNDNIIQNCDISDNGDYGIFFSGSSGNKITKCTLSNNKVISIRSYDTLITESRVDSVYLLDESSIILRDCDDLDASDITAIESDYELIRGKYIDSDASTVLEEQLCEHPVIAKILNFLREIKIRQRASSY